jgi:hypothetical protein
MDNGGGMEHGFTNDGCRAPVQFVIQRMPASRKLK